MLKKNARLIIHCILIGLVLYAGGRLYFHLTAGFTEGNITTDLSLEKDHGLPSLSRDEFSSIEQILNQPYRYLGKGCQSYVFASDDNNYVIKFLKYQRFRPQIYLEAFSFIPFVEKRRVKKIEEKKKKLDELLDSWKIGYRDLKNETGLVYLHLNKSDSFRKPLHIVDKIGLSHSIDLNNVAFLVQKKAAMLCPEILKRDERKAKHLINNLIAMLLSEYTRGFGDNDHALMQNTGVIGDQPLHIDVGQFSKEDRFKSPPVFKKELFSKTYKLRIWLGKYRPELETYLSALLFEIIGPQMPQMKTSFKTIDEGV